MKSENNIKNAGLEVDYLKLVDEANELDQAQVGGWTFLSSANTGWFCSFTKDCNCWIAYKITLTSINIKKGVDFCSFFRIKYNNTSKKDWRNYAFIRSSTCSKNL